MYKACKTDKQIKQTWNRGQYLCLKIIDIAVQFYYTTDLDFLIFPFMFQYKL